MKSKPLMLLLSFLIAFALWAYVVTVVNPESEETFHDVPVIVSGTSVLAERDLMILSDTKMTVDLKLMGNRTDLVKLNSANITVLADLSRITEPGIHKVKYTISYPGSIQSGNIEVLEQEPQYLTVEVVERSRKEIPVKVFYGDTQPQSGYWPDKDGTELSYNFITVTGPKDMVDRIDHAQIQIDLTDRNEIFVENYRPVLCDANGTPLGDVSSITVNVSEIQATVKIHKMLEVPIRVRLEPGEILSAEDVVVTPSVTSLVVTGSKASLEQMDAEILLGPISLEGRQESFTEIFRIELPEGVTLLSGDTTIEVHVQVPEIDTREFQSVSRITPLHVPEGMQVTIITPSLNITVMGLKDKLAGLKESDLIITLDCTNIHVLTTKAQVSVMIRDADGVIVVGTYEVKLQVEYLTQGIDS